MRTEARYILKKTVYLLRSVSSLKSSAETVAANSGIFL